MRVHAIAGIFLTLVVGCAATAVAQPPPQTGPIGMPPSPPIPIGPGLPGTGSAPNMPPTTDKTSPTGGSGSEQMVNPQWILAQVIQQLQTGQLADWYGAQFYQYLQQAAASGVLAQLAQRGPVSRIDLVHAQPLPAGGIYGMVAYHTDGYSRWNLAVSNATRRIEYGAFDVVPGSSPAPSTPQPPGSPPPESESEACKRFRNLC